MFGLGLGCSDDAKNGSAADDSTAPSPSPAAAVEAPPKPEVRELDGPQALAGESASMTAPTRLDLPDVTLTNQAGEAVRLHDLLADKIVVIQTMFTTCGTICPPMGANFGRLQQLLDTAGAEDVALISISVDPITDTPERLRAWAAQFGAGPRWTLLTGSSGDVANTLKALRVFTAEREQHSSMAVIGHQGAGEWTRVDGLSDPATLVRAIATVRATAAAERSPGAIANGAAGDADQNPAHHYFTDVELTDQHGRTHRLYSDLLQGKIVLASSFFTSCSGVCPPMIQRIAELQEPLDDRLGKDLLFLSLTVDPVTDTPAKLAAYAEKFGAKDGWLFLGGSKRNVETALHKLGFAVEVREAHSNLLVVGNEATGLWKKAFAMASPEDLLAVLRSVIDDEGPGSPAPAPAPKPKPKP